ncbi:MAG: endonuclease/exonuclease/phosphatase family protein [Verrucomicrobia bacterium]|nr:endonuclease/exonuclease/phosphatase family protein [Verrucomicrobiota bacterium]MCF7707438.1 endonuclease/exonuclease/phosphatase family protein [Verrucomicrobiota bacterium]
MTYNLRYAGATGPNSWSSRRPLVIDCIKGVRPDVMGTQEGLYEQLKDIDVGLPGYEWIGLGRDGGSHGEFMAVFYRTDRLEPLEFDHFWLSDTPEIIASSTWGNSNRRMVTWVRFMDKTNGGEFYLINTHFDHRVSEARLKSAKLVKKRVDALDTNLPVLLAGDFNAVAGESEPYDVLVSPDGFRDLWVEAEHCVNEGLNTFNGFSFPAKRDGIRIDWILGRGGVKPLTARTVDYAVDEKYPSDHFPVVVDVMLGEAGGR